MAKFLIKRHQSWTIHLKQTVDRILEQVNKEIDEIDELKVM